MTLQTLPARREKDLNRNNVNMKQIDVTLHKLLGRCRSFAKHHSVLECPRICTDVFHGTWLDCFSVACLPQRTVIAVEHLPESVQKVEYYYWPSMRCTAVHSSYLLSHGLSGPNIKLFKCAELPANSCCTREVGLLVYSWNWRLAYLLTWTLLLKEQPTKKSHHLDDEGKWEPEDKKLKNCFREKDVVCAVHILRAGFSVMVPWSHK